MVDMTSALGLGIMATSQVPGQQFAVLWEDEDGVHFGIPTAAQIEDEAHHRIAEISYRFF